MNIAFSTPINGPFATLAVDYSPGDGVLALSDASRIAAATPTPSSPLRLMVETPSGDSFAQFLVASQPAGKIVAVTLVPGFEDVALPEGSTVGGAWSAESVLELQDAILVMADAIDGIQATPGPKGDKGDPGIQGPQGIQGLKGDKGDAGPAGPAGSASAPGSNNSIPYTLNGQFAASTIVTDGSSVIQFAADSATIQTTGRRLVLAQAGDQYGTTSLELMNRVGLNGALFSCDIWLVDFSFLAKSTNKSSNIRYNTDNSSLPANYAAGGEFYFFMDTGPGGSPAIAARIGAGACQFNSPTAFQCKPGQEDDLVTWRDSTGNTLSGVSPGGYVRSIVGSGAPSATPPDGSTYLDNTNALFYVRVAGAWKKVTLS